MDARNLLIYLSIKYKGNWDKIFSAIKQREDEFKDEVIYATLERMKCNAITILDKGYPEELKNIYKPPFVLFYYGDISLINSCKNNLAIVGAREPSEYGVTHLNNIIKDLKGEFTIVSGCALGIDGIAQQAALNYSNKVIGIIGSGFNYYYPSENTELIDTIKDVGLLISEYPENVRPHPDHFLIRNRIIIGLSRSVMVFDVRERSGTFSTTNLTVVSNRNLLSIPYPMDTEFLNNSLLKQGAELIENADDIRIVMSSF